MTELDFSSLDGAALLHEDGVVMQLNDMMQQVYPDLKAGVPGPQELLYAQQPEVFKAMVSIGDAWLALVMPMQCREGTALRLQLTPLRPHDFSDAHLEFAVRNFIQQLSVGKDSVIDKGLVEDNPEFERYLTGLNHQVCRLQKALDQCALPATEGESKLLQPAVDFSALFEKVCCEIEGLQEYLNLSFSWEIIGEGRGRPIFVRGDITVLEKCLFYLFHQGVRLLQKNTAQRQISLRLTQEQGRVRVMLGGSWDVVNRMFQFEQESQLVRVEGLHMAQKLVSNTSGVLLYVVKNDSTVFHLILPAAKMDTGRICSPRAMVDQLSDYPASLVVLSDILPKEVYSPLLID